MMRLNGWQRLWVVVSLILIIPVGFFAFALQGKANQVEDITILEQINADAVIKIKIPGLGIVGFPDNILNP